MWLNNIKEYIKVNKILFIMLSVCFLDATLILLSFFWNPATYIAFALCLISLFLFKNAQKIYFIIFVSFFYNVFRINNNSGYFCLYIIAFAVMLFSVEYLIDLIQKRKKINKKVLITFFVFIIFLCLPINKFVLKDILRTICILVCLYLTFEYRDNLNLKSLILYFSLGLFLSSIFEPLRTFSEKLNSFLPIFSFDDFEHARFCGLLIDPNYFGFDCVLCLAIFVQIFLHDDINYFFYPIFIIITFLVFISLSKAAYICYFILFFIFIIVLIINMFKQKSKENVLKFVFVLLSFIVAILSSLEQFLYTFRRFIDSSSYISIIGAIPLLSISGEIKTVSNNVMKCFSLNQITTGRVDIWLQYLKDCFSSLKNALLGHGLSAEFLEINGVLWDAHNIFIEGLYRLGLIGIFIIIFLCFYLFKIAKDKKKIKILNFIPLFVVLLQLCSISMLTSYKMLIIVIMLAYSILYQKKDIKK